MTWLPPNIFRYDSPKKCPTILYAVNLWLKPVSVTRATVFVAGNGYIAEWTTSQSPRDGYTGHLTKMDHIQSILSCCSPLWPDRSPPLNRTLSRISTKKNNANARVKMKAIARERTQNKTFILLDSLFKTGANQNQTSFTLKALSFFELLEMS